MKKHVPAIMTGLLTVLLASHAEAASRPDFLDQQIRDGQTIEQYLQFGMRALRQSLSPGEPRLTKEAAARFKQQQEDQQRAQMKMQVQNEFARYDKNGDNFADADEIRSIFSASQGLPSELIENRVSTLMQLDSNGDGKLTADEMVQKRIDQSREQMERYNRVRNREGSVDQLLALDKTGEGLTPAAYYAVLKERFTAADTDGNLTISKEEAEAFQNSAAFCPLPDMPADAKLVVYGTGTGKSVPDVTVNGQDKVMSAAHVKIDTGAEPLYIVLTSQEPMIWQLEGATDRVANLVISQRGQTNSGVTGVAREKVSFIGDGCRGLSGVFDRPQGSARDVLVSSLAGRLKHEPDAVFGNRNTASISLPSGTAEEPAAVAAPKGFDEKVWQSLLRFTPGGVDTIDPAKVISEGSAEKYEVLPHQAGLAQLAGSGKLTLLSEGSIMGRYRIEAGMTRFPPGLYGAQSVNFVLPAGQKRPEGDPGHSQITIEGK